MFQKQLTWFCCVVWVENLCSGWNLLIYEPSEILIPKQLVASSWVLLKPTGSSALCLAHSGYRVAPSHAREYQFLEPAWSLCYQQDYKRFSGNFLLPDNWEGSLSQNRFTLYSCMWQLVWETMNHFSFLKERQERNSSYCFPCCFLV